MASQIEFKEFHDREFYQSQFWKELSKLCRRRDRWTCRKCGRVARTEKEKREFHADHIIPRSKGGKDKLANLVTKCEDCHCEKHPHMANLIEYKRNGGEVKKPFRPTKYARPNPNQVQRKQTIAIKSRLY